MNKRCDLCTKETTLSCYHSDLCCRCYDNITANMPDYIRTVQEEKYIKMKVNKQKESK